MALAQLPHLTADELAVLLHGLKRLTPGLVAGTMPTVSAEELTRIVPSLATAVREAMITAERLDDDHDELPPGPGWHAHKNDRSPESR